MTPVLSRTSYRFAVGARVFVVNCKDTGGLLAAKFYFELRERGEDGPLCRQGDSPGEHSADFAKDVVERWLSTDLGSVKVTSEPPFANYVEARERAFQEYVAPLVERLASENVSRETLPTWRAVLEGQLEERTKQNPDYLGIVERDLLAMLDDRFLDSPYPERTSAS